MSEVVQCSNTSRESGTGPLCTILEDGELIITEGRAALLAILARVCRAGGVWQNIRGLDALGPQVIIKADKAFLMSCLYLNIYTSWKGAFAHECRDMRGIWAFERGVKVEISGEEAVTLLRGRRGRERYRDRWKEELRRMETWPLLP